MIDELSAKGPTSEDDVARASVAVGEAKVLTTEIALLAGEKLFELAGAARKDLIAQRHWP